MNYRLVHDEHFAAVPAEAYTQLWTENGSPAFYHPEFLAAAEQFPLLPIVGAHYLSAWQGDRLCAFLVAWQQVHPDPFGTLTLNHDRLLALTGRQTLRNNRNE